MRANVLRDVIVAVTYLSEDKKLAKILPLGIGYAILSSAGVESVDRRCSRESKQVYLSGEIPKLAEGEGLLNL